MSEKEYWLALEFRLCRELDGLREREFLGVWCDGFIPETFEFGPDGAVISGQVWLGFGRHRQEAWRFRLIVDRMVTRREDVRWENLLPGDDVTGWLSVDWPEKLLTIKPLNAYTDRVS